MSAGGARTICELRGGDSRLDWNGPTDPRPVHDPVGRGGRSSGVAGGGPPVSRSRSRFRHSSRPRLAVVGQISAPESGRVRWGRSAGSIDRWLSEARCRSQPVFSPDGTRLAFNSDRGGNLDIWELELASGAVRRLTVASSDDWDPAYTRDGMQLLWSSNRSGNFEVWIAASDGSGARKLSSDGVDAENPTATPDGRWIVYSSANPAQNGIWKIRPDGTEAQRVASGRSACPSSPRTGGGSLRGRDQGRVRVVALDDGAEIAAIDLSLARSGTSIRPQSLAARLVDPGLGDFVRRVRHGCTAVAPGRRVRSAARSLAAPRAQPESFAISPMAPPLLDRPGSLDLL
jgi:hypothetical protein